MPRTKVKLQTVSDSCNEMSTAQMREIRVKNKQRSLATDHIFVSQIIAFGLLTKKNGEFVLGEGSASSVVKLKENSSTFRLVLCQEPKIPAVLFFYEATYRPDLFQWHDNSVHIC